MPEIRNAMIASAQPLNGAAPGTWNVAGGYGLIDAVKALSAVSGLSVLATTPANGALLTQAPASAAIGGGAPASGGWVGPALADGAPASPCRRGSLTRAGTPGMKPTAAATETG